jgi:uncharacterized membrane protein YfcA
VAIVLVRGTGDVASAVALMLFRAGYQVVLHDRPKPSHARRGTALVDALFEGRVEREGVHAKYARSLESLRHMLRCKRALPVADGDFEELLRAVKPQVVVDARLRKHEKPESQRGLAPLTIGLGPNFVAGETTDLVVETAYGKSLGTVIRLGPAQELLGEPQMLGGHGRDRFVYAPVSGIFRTTLEIGTQVVAGQSVGTIDDVAVQAPLTGRLRGLPHHGALIEQRSKIVEVDASETADAIRRLGERPRRIAEGVLTAIRETAVRGDRWRAVGEAFSSFGVGTAVGALGGLIGLGGAEFRLPLLVGLYRFEIRQAIVVNVLVSLVTVVFSLAFRSAIQDTQALVVHWPAALSLVVGSIAGALIGSHVALRLRPRSLSRLVGTLLGLLALVIIMHGLHPVGNVLESDQGPLVLSLGVLVGIPIGAVSSMLGVAGGELLIPTLVLLYGIEIKIAGTLSLAISVPMLLVAIQRLRHSMPMGFLAQRRRFIACLALGSVAGAYLGSNLLGLVSVAVLSILLGILLLISAFKVFRPR